MIPKINLLVPYRRKRDLARIKEWTKSNPEKRKRTSRKYTRAFKKEVVEAYGGQCQACQESELCVLSIDHVYDDGAREREKPGWGVGYQMKLRLKELGWPQDRYQLLCMNCQYRKREYGRDTSKWPTPPTAPASFSYKPLRCSS